MCPPVPQHPAAPSQRLTRAEVTLLVINSGKNSKNTMTFCLNSEKKRRWSTTVAKTAKTSWRFVWTLKEKKQMGTGAKLAKCGSKNKSEKRMKRGKEKKKRRHWFPAMLTPLAFLIISSDDQKKAFHQFWGLQRLSARDGKNYISRSKTCFSLSGVTLNV